MFHHRFPTSTVNVKRAAHPFSTKDYFGDTQYVLVHNGVIRNADELFTRHQELGIEYYSLLDDLTFNDSEALLWDFALTMEGKQPEMTAYGAMAIICIKLVKGKIDRILFGRNSNPINMYRAEDGILLSSEGEGEPIDSDRLYTFHFKSRRLYQKDMNFPSYNPNHVVSYIREEERNRNWNYQRDSYYPYTDAAYDDRRDYDWSAYEEDDDDWDGRYGVDNKQWLGEYLKDKYRKFFNKDGTLKSSRQREVMEYEHDPETQLMLPVGTKQVKTKLDRQQMEYNLIEAKKRTPTALEIRETYLDYLQRFQGHFEQVFWALESDVEELENKVATLDNIRQKVLLDMVLVMLEDDPNYEDEESVSTIWRDICQTQHALTM